MTVSVGPLLLALAVLLVVSLYVFRPFLIPHRTRARRLSDREALAAQKDAYLEQIRALDFDFQTDKIAQVEYERQRADLVQAAADVLRRLEQMPDSRYDNTDDRIEAAVARLRHREAAPSVPQTAPQTAPQSAPRPFLQPAAAVADGGPLPAGGRNFCPQCGLKVEPADRFCANCGHKLL